MIVFANHFDRSSRNFLSVVRSLFTKPYPNFVTFVRFFKIKKKISKIRKKSEKNSCVFGQINKSILAENKLSYRFFVE